MVSTSTHLFTDSIRYFKANDPYHWTVNNVPLKQLEENILWVKDQVGNPLSEEEDNSIVGDVDRSTFTELRPFSTGSMKVTVSPGQFMGRVNDAYGTGISDLVVNALMDYSKGGYERSRSVTLPDNILYDLIGASTSGVLGNNGLYDHLQTHVANFDSVGSIEYQHMYGKDKKNLKLGMYDIPKVKLSLWQQDTTTNTLWFPNPTDLQQLAVNYTRVWGSPFRTSLVNVNKQLDIDIPILTDNDYVSENPTIAPDLRIDLLFVYTKPIDASSTTIAKPQASIGSVSPVTLTAPALGIVKGAGIVSLSTSSIGGEWDGQKVDSTFLDTPLYKDNKDNKNNFLKRELSNLDANLNPQIASPLGDAMSTGNFPSPDDLMNLAPYLADELAGSKSSALIGQSVLPLAYIFVRRDQTMIKNSDILDIRPFFRTAELTYNERAGLAAANPPASLANPVVTDSDLQRRISEVKRTIVDVDAFMPTMPTIVGAGTIFGGLKFGVEGALLRMGAVGGAGSTQGGFQAIESPPYNFDVCSLYYGENQDIIETWFQEQFGYHEGGEMQVIPLDPDWDLADWAVEKNCAGWVTDYINVGWTTAAGHPKSTGAAATNNRTPQFGPLGRAMETWIATGSKEDGRSFVTPGKAFLWQVDLVWDADDRNGRVRLDGTQITYVKKKINIDTTDVSNWMGSYDVKAQFVNCVPKSGGGKHVPNASFNWGVKDDWGKVTPMYETFHGIFIEKYKTYFNIVVAYPTPSINTPIMYNGWVNWDWGPNGPSTGYNILGDPVGDYDHAFHPINVRGTDKSKKGYWNGFGSFAVTSDFQKGLQTVTDQKESDMTTFGKVSNLNSNIAFCAYPTVSFTIIGNPRGFSNDNLGGNVPTITLRSMF